jgi:uncharacterized protein YbaA (DUF1428 family)
MAYVDGFLLPVPKRNRKRYRDLAREAGKVWMEYGALGYHECIADDVPIGKQVSFPKGVKLKKGEEVWFSWIVYQSRRQRDRVNAQVMRDPRIARMMGTKAMPFDSKRMAYGGFRMMVNLKPR